jgi:thiamine pyrophosphate-dependent acetolactate synthase large subunit-like protein
MLVPEAIARILKAEGVKYVFAYPLNPIIEAAAAVDIRPIIVRQERTGAHMADALSRMTSGDEIGVFVMQHGPGAENTFGGVAQCYGESVPVLFMPAGYDRNLAHYFPNFNSVLNMKHITKWAEPITSGKEVANVMRRAFSQLRNGRPGPVLVEIPWDACKEDADITNYKPVYKTRTAPDPEHVKAAARELAAADKPVIYAGQGIHYSKAWDELKEIAELLNAPVTTSIAGKSAFDETHPLALGSGGHATTQMVYTFLYEADLIFGIGCSFAISSFATRMPPNGRYIHATLDPVDLNKDVPSEIGMAGDAKLTLQALIAELKKLDLSKAKARKDSMPAAIAKVREEWMAKWLPKLTSEQNPMTPYRVIYEMNKYINKDKVVITHDAGSPRDQLIPFWQSTKPLSYIGWGKTTQLGYGLPLAMGAKLAKPDHLCMNVWGDAAIGFTGMDFETAVRERIPILSILFNNFSMAMEIPIMKVSDAKYNTCDISGNYADMAKAFGGYGERITDPKDIIPALKRGIEATERGQAALLEFITCKETDMSLFYSSYGWKAHG